MKKNELIVLLPAYNEEKDVEKMVRTWQKYRNEILEQYNLLLKIAIINDGSADQTEKIVRRLMSEMDNVTLINHEVNKGLGKAVETGFRYVTEKCPDAKFACLMDCDNTQPPKFVLDMLAKTKANRKEYLYDVVIASRYQKGSKVNGVAGYRLLTSSGARFVYSALLPIHGVKDYTCGYRLYSKDILIKAFSEYGRNFVTQSGFTCMAEIIYRLSKIGARIAEVPFELRYDAKGGASKMKVFKTAWNSVTMAVTIRRQKRIRK
jgi:dolichol-phosphate mannosyltransferase